MDPECRENGPDEAAGNGEKRQSLRLCLVTGPRLDLAVSVSFAQRQRWGPKFKGSASGSDAPALQAGKCFAARRCLRIPRNDASGGAALNGGRCDEKYVYQ